MPRHAPRRRPALSALFAILVYSIVYRTSDKFPRALREKNDYEQPPPPTPLLIKARPDAEAALVSPLCFYLRPLDY